MDIIIRGAASRMEAEQTLFVAFAYDEKYPDAVGYSERAIYDPAFWTPPVKGRAMAAHRTPKGKIVVQFGDER